MYYINACELLNTCIKAEILQGEENDHVFIYREAGTPKEEWPEGWYKEPFDDVATRLVDDTKGTEFLQEALLQRGITPRYTDVEKMQEDCVAFMDFFETMINTGHCWTS